MLEPLYTLKGNKIWYSKYGVGKQVGSKLYLHINSYYDIISPEIFYSAKVVLEDNNIPIYDFNTICYDFEKPHIIRFDTCDGFSTEDEPTVGHMVFVDTNTFIIKEKHNPQIYHHKWLWVPDKFEGFDTHQSWERSKEWLSKLNETASGYRNKWNQQLKSIGMQ